MCKYIHSFFSESYFTHASDMQCSRSSAPEIVDDSFSSGRSSVMYWDYLTSSQMSARVPTPFGSLAAASRARVRMVTHAGLSFFSMAWYLGLPVSTDSFFATGATVTFRPSQQEQTQGLVGLAYLWAYCLLKLSTHSLFLGLTVTIFFKAIILRSPLSSPIASSSSCTFSFVQSQRYRISLGQSSYTSPWFSSSVSVASLFSDASPLSSRSSIDSTSLSSSRQAKFQSFLAGILFLSSASCRVIQSSRQISFNFWRLSSQFISSSFSREALQYPFLSCRSKFQIGVFPLSPLAVKTLEKRAGFLSGRNSANDQSSSGVKLFLMLSSVSMSARESKPRRELVREMYSPWWQTAMLLSSRMTSSWPSREWRSWLTSSVALSSLPSRNFLKLTWFWWRNCWQARELQRWDILNLMAMNLLHHKYCLNHQYQSSLPTISLCFHFPTRTSRPSASYSFPSPFFMSIWNSPSYFPPSLHTSTPFPCFLSLRNSPSYVHEAVTYFPRTLWPLLNQPWKQQSRVWPGPALTSQNPCPSNLSDLNSPSQMNWGFSRRPCPSISIYVLRGPLYMVLLLYMRMHLSRMMLPSQNPAIISSSSFELYILPMPCGAPFFHSPQQYMSLSMATHYLFSTPRITPTTRALYYPLSSDSFLSILAFNLTLYLRTAGLFSSLLLLVHKPMQQALLSISSISNKQTLFTLYPSLHPSPLLMGSEIAAKYIFSFLMFKELLDIPSNKIAIPKWRSACDLNLLFGQCQQAMRKLEKLEQQKERIREKINILLQPKKKPTPPKIEAPPHPKTLTSHKIITKPKNPERWKCQIKKCGRVMTSLDNYHRHMRKIHDAPWNPSQKRANPPQEGRPNDKLA